MSPKIKFIKSGFFSRMLLIIGIASLLPLSAMVFISAKQTDTVLRNDIHERMDLLGVLYTERIESLLDDYFSSVKTVASIAGGYQNLPAEIRRPFLSNIVRETLSYHEGEFHAVWLQMEPGAIEDNENEYYGSVLSAPNGGFNTTWYFDDGELVQGEITNEAYNGDFYTVPRTNRKSTVIKPYWWSYTGDIEDAVLETSLCVPVVIEDRFLGVAGADVSLNQIQDLINSFEIPNNGYIVLIDSESAVRLSHPERTQLGTPISNLLNPGEYKSVTDGFKNKVPFSLTNMPTSDGSPARVNLNPIRIDDAGNTWYVATIMPNSHLYKNLNTIVEYQIFFGIVTFMIMLTAIYIASKTLSKPILEITQKVQLISAGRFNLRFDNKYNNELDLLIESFNTMTARVKELLEQHESANRNLEKMVSERTSELNKTIQDLNSSQESLIHSEKLAVLGNLMANIAHELNTPLGAIDSSISYIIEDGIDTIIGLPEQTSNLNPDELEILKELENTGRKAALDIQHIPDRKRKRSMAKILTELGVEDAENLADELETMGAAGDQARIIELIKNGDRKLIDAAVVIISVMRGLYIIQQASRKAVSTISALSGYIHSTPDESFTEVDICSEIDNILILYYNQIKKNVTLNKEYKTATTVSGNRDKLNQVWINLINNSLHAIEYKGLLGIEVRDEGEFICVSIKDDGHGIPENMQSRIFDPFFTTKSEGEGTGLGLDICRKIIEEHEGRIEFTSRPGETVFSVYLPRLLQSTGVKK